MKERFIFDTSAPETVPDELISALRGHGFEKNDILLFFKTDLDKDRNLCDCYVFITEEKLAVLCGVFGARVTGDQKRRSILVFTESSYKEYPIKELSDFRVKEYISSLALTCEIDGIRIVLAQLSVSYREDAQTVCRYLNEYKENGKYTADPFGGAKKELFCPKCGLRYADPDNKICPHCRKRSSMIRRTAGLFGEYRLKLGIVVLLLVLSAALSVIAPYFSAGFFYDKVLGDKNDWFYGRIFLALGVILATRFLSMLVSIFHNILTSVLAADMTCKLRSVIFSSINRLSVGFFTSRKTGGLMTQVNSDSQTIYWFFCESLPYFAVNITQVIAITIIMLLISPLLCLAAVVLVPVTFFVIKAVFKKMDKLHNRRYGRVRSMNSSLSDMLGGIRVVKAFSGEENEKKRFAKKSKDLASADLETNVYAAKVFPAIGLLLHLGSVFVWAIGGVMILLHYKDPSLIGSSTVLTYGMLATFISYVSMIYAPLYSFVDMISMTADSMNAMGRLIEIMDAKADVTESAHPITPERMKGEIVFDDVCFSYESGMPVLEHLNFTAEAGKTLGIVGKTGAGKSTLANLVIRLYDPTKGCIRIDGVDLRELSFEYLRSNVSIVSQDTYLFSGTILDNVRYANPSASLDEVFSACVASGAHEFIMKLRDGYDTRIGQGNADLSGGERQRLSIARAILKNPRILILDEATAAMDTRTEQIIQRSITELSKGRTTLIIAHRLSTLRDADRLIVIDKKTVAENGTPEELIKQKGVYFNLYKLQLEALRTIGIAEE